MGIDLWKLGMDMRNPGGFRSNSFLNPLQNSFPARNVWLSDLKLSGKKPDKGLGKKSEKRPEKNSDNRPDKKSDKQSDEKFDKGSDHRLYKESDKRTEKRYDGKPGAETTDELHENQSDEKLEVFEEKETWRGSKAPETLAQKPSLDLQEAVVWSEILGDPVSRKRRKKRMGQLYGNQSYAGRR